MGVLLATLGDELCGVTEPLLWGAAPGWQLRGQPRPPGPRGLRGPLSLGGGAPCLPATAQEKGSWVPTSLWAIGYPPTSSHLKLREHGTLGKNPLSLLILSIQTPCLSTNSLYKSNRVDSLSTGTHAGEMQCYFFDLFAGCLSSS